jgi:transposase
MECADGSEDRDPAPHKGSHTAVAVGAAEEPLGTLRVRACPDQDGKLVDWAGAWPERTWAVEGAARLGGLLAQQLVAAGERVLDVQPKLAVWVRLLQSGNTGKNDPNDALSVAVAALRSAAGQDVTADGHARVLKVWAKRHRDPSRARNQAVCRLHAVLCELVPGGVAEEITAGQAAKLLSQISPSGPVAQARCEVAAELLSDIRYLDARRLDARQAAAACAKDPGGQPGNYSVSRAASSHPHASSSDKQYFHGLVRACPACCTVPAS